MKEIVLATRNIGKVKELTALLGNVVEKVTSLRELNSVPDIVEDGDTFRMNALKKARLISKATQKITLADDSGLEVDGLGGRPGVFSSRYAGENASDKDNIRKLLKELNGIGDRKARFVCNLALVFPNGEEIVVEGICEGVILEKPRGEGGFGYDPVFLLPDINKTMAELATEEKNLISHRSRAVRALVMYINGQKARK
ncbi:MAG TPA: XTP/dITP diphosphatase [Thermodesulfobacteriota bacterium]|nr:XTP/dITP diphosphatase [Thermodesulfobacteriota bacterium]